jgi:hypothetical protein
MLREAYPTKFLRSQLQDYFKKKTNIAKIVDNPHNVGLYAFCKNLMCSHL